MKIYLLNLIVKSRAQEASLTYSHFKTIHFSKFLCPECIVLFISKICQLEWLQSTKDIISVPQNNLDKLLIKFPEEVIIKRLFFLSEIYKNIQIQFQRHICSSICKIYYIISKTCHIYIQLIVAKVHENSKLVTLPFLPFIDVDWFVQDW